MKLLDDFNNWRFMKFGKEQWALVKIIEEPVTIEKKPCKFYFRLFESNKGSRKVEFGCTMASIPDLAYIAVQMDTYQGRIVRWKNGRYDPDIPRYSETAEEDTVNALRGKV